MVYTYNEDHYAHLPKLNRPRQKNRHAERLIHLP